MTKHPILKDDRFRRSRGGYTRMLLLSCAHCKHPVCAYQKDGPGILKRLYADRILGYGNTKKTKMVCRKCGRLLGIRTLYAKEKRPAFSLFVGTIDKRTIGVGNVSRDAEGKVVRF